MRRPAGKEYTLGEEIANSITSGVGAALSLAGLIILIIAAARQGDAWHITGVIVFGLSLILSHLASTLYHSIAPPRAKRVFKIFDHLAIYLLIAGTYTPFLLVNLRGTWGWILFTLIWTLALLGVLIKLTALDKVPFLSTGFYVAMGWSVIIAVNPVIENVAAGGLWLLLAGGLSYTFGIVFYAWKSLPYAHAVWHLFVVGGSLLHFFAVFYYVIPPAA